jgi:ribose 5-phosphate isomerase B
MKIAIGCDENALELKNALTAVMEKKGIEYKDFGVFTKDPSDYPDLVKQLIPQVQNGSYHRGILVCGTGIGMAICANKFKGIRAAVCHDLYSAQRSILSNDCQVLCMGSLIIGKGLAEEILKVWLSIESTGGTVAKVKKIEQLES